MAERAAARDVGAIEHVIQPCISDFSLSETVCEDCVAALHAMSTRLHAQTVHGEGTESLEQMLQLDVAWTLVNALTHHPRSRTITEYGVHLLGSLTSHEHLLCFKQRDVDCLAKQVVVSSGAIPVICEALQQFPGAAQVQRWGVQTLKSISDHRITRRLGAKKTDLYDIVIDRPAPGDMDWLVAVRDTLVAHGAVALVVVAMELHPGEEVLQSDGCWLLSMMATHSVEQKEAARSAGAMAVALAAMRANLDKVHVQLACVSPLITMLGPSGWIPSGWDATGSATSEFGALDALAKRTELYSFVRGRLPSPVDTEWRELSCYPDYMAPGVVETVAEMMRTYPHDADLQHAGCIAVGTLVSPAQQEGEQVCKREARAAGMPKLIVDALNAHLEVKQITVECTKALAELIGTPRLTDRYMARDMLKVGALRAIVEVMNTEGDPHSKLLPQRATGPSFIMHYISLRRMNCCMSLRNLHAGGDDLHKALVAREEWWTWCQNFAKMGDDVSRLGFAFGQVLGYGGMVLVAYLLWRALGGGRNPVASCALAFTRCITGRYGRDPHAAKTGSKGRRHKKHARE